MTSYSNKLNFFIEPLIGAPSMPALAESDCTSLVDRTRFRLQQRDLNRQSNLERIIELATRESPVELTDIPASRDWLDAFINYAQDVSDETAQQFWARMLALYIANPDGVFKRSLVALHHLDTWEVKAFIEYCSFAFTLESGWRFVFEDMLTRREMWGYVQGQDFTQHFISIGLLSSELATMRPRVSRGMKIRYFAKEYEMIPPEETDNKGDSLDISFGYRKFTPTGQQLAKAVKARVYYGYARNLIRTLDAQRNVQFRLLETEDSSGILPLSNRLQAATT